MTNPFGDPDTGWNSEPVDYFDGSLAQGHLLIVRVHDVPQYFRTANNPDGLVHPTRGATWEAFPNSVVRASVADLSIPADDMTQGKIYPEAVIFPSSLVKVMKSWVGQGPKLLTWRKIGPKQTDPYEMINMAGDEQAVAAATKFLERHPEFMTIPAPAPYDGKPPVPMPPAAQPAQQYPPQNWNPQYQQGPPQQPQWQPQGPPVTAPWQQPNQWARQPQQAPQQPGWQQQPPQYQQPPPQQRQGSFLSQMGQQQGLPVYTQHEPGGSFNHHGQPQQDETPF